MRGFYAAVMDVVYGSQQGRLYREAVAFVCRQTRSVERGDLFDEFVTTRGWRWSFEDDELRTTNDELNWATKSGATRHGCRVRPTGSRAALHHIITSAAAENSAGGPHAPSQAGTRTAYAASRNRCMTT